jgi:hypothetical protein
MRKCAAELEEIQKHKPVILTGDQEAAEKYELP